MVRIAYVVECEREAPTDANVCVASPQPSRATSVLALRDKAVECLENFKLPLVAAHICLYQWTF